MASVSHVDADSGRRSAYGQRVAGAQRRPSHDEASRYSRSVQSGEYAVRAKKGRKFRRRKIVMAFVIALAVLVVGGAGAALAFINHIEGNMNRGVDQQLLDSLHVTDSPSDPFYMLLIGIDRSQEREDADEYGGAYRTDSMILTRVDPKEKTVTMVSIPRDIKVQLGTHGTQKINAAYAFEGPSGAIDAVSKLAGVPISHYAEIDFDGFKAVVDALGGVDVDVAFEIDDSYAGGHVDQGLHTLNGEEALILCRSRHAYDDVTDGDQMRAANQRLVLSAIMKKVVSSDVGTMTNTISTLSNYVTTDYSVSAILGLAQTMMGIDVDQNVYTAGVPTTSSYENDIWFEIVNEKEWREMMERVDAGLSPTEESTVDAGSGVITSYAGDGGHAGQLQSEANLQRSLANTRIAVRNGTSTNGVAAQAADKLTPYGAIVDTGNADDANYTQTIVVYEDDKDQPTAQMIADELGCGATRKNNGVYLFESDYLVVIGSDWSQ